MTVDGRLVKFIPPRPDQRLQEVQEVLITNPDPPVFRAELPDGRIAWLVHGYENVRQMLADQRISRALAVTPEHAGPGFEVFAGGSISGMDPPEQTRLRKLVGNAFTARRVEGLRPRVAEIVNELIDAMLERPQPVDLVAAFSLPLPAQVMCEMLGVPPEDLSQFHAWSDTIMGNWERSADDIMMALAELYGYFGKLMEIKRSQPAGDLMSALIAARDDDDRLSEDELTVMCCTLLIGGHETTASEISLALLMLLDHPDEIAKLRADPGLLPGAVEELLRCAPLGRVAPARVTREEVTIGGVTIPADQVVVPLYGSANRDPAVFKDPLRFDITREAAGDHVSFGLGVHHCIGAQLARVELQEAFRGLMGRLPGLRLAVPASELEFKEGMVINSLRELPVLWGEP